MLVVDDLAPRNIPFEEACDMLRFVCVCVCELCVCVCGERERERELEKNARNFFWLSSGYIYLHLMYFYFLLNRECTNTPRCGEFMGFVCTCVLYACVCVCMLCVCVLKSSEGKKILRSLGVPTDEQDGGQGGGDMHAAGCAEVGTHTHTHTDKHTLPSQDARY